jgi:hypothetical protein
MLTDPTNVALLMLANVSHKTCRMTAVAKAPPTLQLKDFAHEAVDAGADIFVGGHAHWPKGNLWILSRLREGQRVEKWPSDHYLVLGQLTLIG